MLTSAIFDRITDSTILCELENILSLKEQLQSIIPISVDAPEEIDYLCNRAWITRKINFVGNIANDLDLDDSTKLFLMNNYPTTNLSSSIYWACNTSVFRRWFAIRRFKDSVCNSAYELYYAGYSKITKCRYIDYVTIQQSISEIISHYGQIDWKHKPELAKTIIKYYNDFYATDITVDQLDHIKIMVNEVLAAAIEEDISIAINQFRRHLNKL